MSILYLVQVESLGLYCMVARPSCIISEVFLTLARAFDMIGPQTAGYDSARCASRVRVYV